MRSSLWAQPMRAYAGKAARSLKKEKTGCTAVIASASSGGNPSGLPSCPGCRPRRNRFAERIKLVSCTMAGDTHAIASRERFHLSCQRSTSISGSGEPPLPSATGHVFSHRSFAVSAVSDDLSVRTSPSFPHSPPALLVPLFAVVAALPAGRSKVLHRPWRWPGSAPSQARPDVALTRRTPHGALGTISGCCGRRPVLSQNAGPLGAVGRPGRALS